jgi:hypothetical protein
MGFTRPAASEVAQLFKLCAWGGAPFKRLEPYGMPRPWAFLEASAYYLIAGIRASFTADATDEERMKLNEMVGAYEAGVAKN